MILKILWEKSKYYYTISCFDITVKPAIRLNKVISRIYNTVDFANGFRYFPKFPGNSVISQSSVGFERTTVLYENLHLVLCKDKTISRNKIENRSGVNYTIIGFNEFAAEIVFRNLQLV